MVVMGQVSGARIKSSMLVLQSKTNIAKGYGNYLLLEMFGKTWSYESYTGSTPIWFIGKRFYLAHGSIQIRNVARKWSSS